MIGLSLLITTALAVANSRFISLIGDFISFLYTTSDVGKGTGLALSVTHGIIISHKGGYLLKVTQGKAANLVFIYRS